MKKKIIIAVIITLAILVVGGGVLALTMLSPKPAPLSNPTGLQVIELQDGTKKIYVDRHTNASGYLFSVQKVGETETQSTQGPANEFNANTLLATPATYKISCQYVGSDANYKSQKAQEISGNPKVSLLFAWLDLERQLRINLGVDRFDNHLRSRRF